MTKKFDEKARLTLQCELVPDYIIYDGVTKVRDMAVNTIKKSEARKYIASFHYSKTFPDSTLFAYAGFLGDKLAGIITYGMGAGVSQYRNVIPDIKNGEYAELTRLWCPDSMPRNTESKLIAESIKLLPVRIKLLISFSDESQGHCGYIYQATNWIYCGKNNGGKVLVDANGIVCHSRLIGMYRKRHPEYASMTRKEIMTKHGFREEKGGRKHKYVKFRGSRAFKKGCIEEIKQIIESYPKGDL